MNFGFKHWMPEIRSPYQFFSRGVGRYISLGLTVILGVSASLILYMRPAPAIEELQLTYGPANIALEFADLQTFAETGEQSNQLRSLFTLAELTPQQIADFQEALNYGVTIPANLVDTLLNSSYGRLAIGAFNLVVSPTSNINDIVEGLISALQSAARDGNITFLDLVLGYKGLTVISINVEELISLYNDVVVLGEQAIEFLKAQPEVQSLICE